MEELIGQKLGQYQIEAKIGSGGMASIFKAYQPSLERYVAIKVLPPSLASKNPIFIQRFQREAKAVAQLHHPNIVPVYDFGIDLDYSYIVMRYVEGAQTLGQIMPYSFNRERIIHLINQIASALTYAHQRGVIHRDVKPSNILLDGDWALLSDFGLAQVEEAVSRLTDSGMSIGTPAYMSPEQARGESVSYSTDIYSLGVITYEMLTHTIPHNAPTPVGILMKRMTQPPASPRLVNPDISPHIEHVVLRSLSVNPQDRYASAAEYAAALAAALANGADPVFAAALSDKKTAVFNPDSTIKPYPEKDSLTRTGLHRLRQPVWLVSITVGIVLLALAWWGSNIFRQPIPQGTPSQVAAGVPATPTPTHTPTLTPSPTSTDTPQPPTATPSPVAPSPTPMPTNTPALPTVTPVFIIVTATATDTPTPMPTPIPPVPTVMPTIGPSPTPSLAEVTFMLLNPASLDEPSYGPTIFEWEWQGAVPSGFGFEVRVWREGEPPAGVHDAVLDNTQGRIEKIAANRYRLEVDISQAAGVRQRTGEYLWTVALVQISPNYADLGVQAEPGRLRFEAGGGKDGGGKDGGSGSGGIS
jgi:serine/threonine-protein kinase